MAQEYDRSTVTITNMKLEGDLSVPQDAKAIVLFAHGSGSNRYSIRNKYVEQVLNNAGFATLLIDLLTPQEKVTDEKTRHLRFDIDLLANRLAAITQWLVHNPETSRMKIGYFGSSSGAAAALISAAQFNDVKTIVSRGGRTDLIDHGILRQIIAPTLLIVGGNDLPLIGINRAALEQLSNAEVRELAVIPSVGHLFEEPGGIEEVARIATEWFECFLLGKGRKFENRYGSKMPRLPLSFGKFSLHTRFKDRMAAGQILASILGKYSEENTITVIGIPRGGVIVADVVAKKLKADMDVVVSRKIRAPDNPEKAIGAVTQDGLLCIDHAAVESMNISKEYIDAELQRQKKEVEQRLRLYRPSPREYAIRNRSVVVVDDGAASGSTVIIATRWIRKQQPKQIIIALPVAPKSVSKLLQQEADIVETIKSPSRFENVEEFYQDYHQVRDAEVLERLKSKGIL